jgi:FhuF 2Fe-2S C-terminal domain
VTQPPVPAGPGPVAAALAEAATLGEYFTLACGPADGGWRPARAAYGQGLRELIGYTAQQLGAGENRVAASIAQLGYAARVWSPVLACALLDGLVPDLHDLQLSAQLPVRLRLPRPGGWAAVQPAVQAGLVYRTVVDEHLVPLAAGLEVKIASGLLWGNAASAMTGALGVIAAARPDLAGPARVLAGRLLATGRLSGTGDLTGPGLAFRRRSCCLYYRVPGGGLCADCSLAPRSGPDPAAGRG